MPAISINAAFHVQESPLLSLTHAVHLSSQRPFPFLSVEEVVQQVLKEEGGTTTPPLSALLPRHQISRTLETTATINPCGISCNSATMDPFKNMSNHMVSNSAAAINASDDISTLDPDESVLSLAKGPRRRQHDDEESEGLEDDLESLATDAIDGQKQVVKAEEEKELPPHACACV